MHRRQPRPTLFPYTTLFRSRRRRTQGIRRAQRPGKDPRKRAASLRPLSVRSEEHASELQSPCNLVCRLLLEKKKSMHKGERGRAEEVSTTLQSNAEDYYIVE